jgi:putative SOS response-associated peptidase YedK
MTRSFTKVCGRFTRYLSWSEIHRLYRLTAPADIGRNTEPRYNIARTEDVLFVTVGDNGNHKLREGRWWLVPWWAKEMPKAATFNARSETIETSGSFKDAFKSKRCLIPADGFYEWTISPADRGRDLWHIFLPGPAPFSFAGLWAYKAWHHQLHHHHRSGDRAGKANPRSHAGDPRSCRL